MKKIRTLLNPLNFIEKITALLIILACGMYLANNYVSRSDSRSDRNLVGNINSQDFMLKAFFEKEGYYPSIANYSDQEWREINLIESDSLSFNPNDYSYQPIAKNNQICDKKFQKCTSYKLFGQLSDGDNYVVGST